MYASARVIFWGGVWILEHLPLYSSLLFFSGHKLLLGISFIYTEQNTNTWPKTMRQFGYIILNLVVVDLKHEKKIIKK